MPARRPQLPAMHPRVEHLFEERVPVWVALALIRELANWQERESMSRE
jgi:hypothetical protein